MEGQPNNQTLNKSSLILLVTLGFVLGALASAVGFNIYRKLSTSHTHPLAGGWVLDPAESGNLDGDVPRSFDFRESTVDIETVDGRKVTCEYDIERAEDVFVGPLTIHDYFGTELTYNWSKQPTVILSTPDDSDDKNRYLFAG